MNKLSPFSPKTTFYMNNGVGRDIYISYNSGGIFPNQTSKFQGNYTFGSKVFSVSPKIPTKTVFKLLIDYIIVQSYYFPDGSGRDYYIIKNQGNGSGWEFPRQKHFQKQLRFYQPENKMMLNMASPKNIRYFDDLKKKNKDLLKRLVPLAIQKQQKTNAITKIQLFKAKYALNVAYFALKQLIFRDQRELYAEEQ